MGKSTCPLFSWVIFQGDTFLNLALSYQPSQIPGCGSTVVMMLKLNQRNSGFSPWGFLSWSGCLMGHIRNFRIMRWYQIETSEGTVELIFEVTLLLSLLNPQCFKILISPHSLKGYCFHYIFIKAILVYIALWFSGKFPWRLMVLSIFIPGIRNSLNNYLIRYFIYFKIFVFKKLFLLFLRL